MQGSVRHYSRVHSQAAGTNKRSNQNARSHGYERSQVSRALLQHLRAHGFQLIRQHKHLVFRHTASGRNFVTSKTPSDRFAENNVRAELRRFLRVNACGGGA
jgi:predicted RNA binding protein YcfA (HicA-like mRNA interferase family)